MGLLFEYSDHNNRTYPSAKTTPPTESDIQTPDDDLSDLAHPIADTGTFTGRDIAFTSIIIVLTFFGLLFFMSTTYSFFLLIDNPQVLESNDPFAAAQTLLEDPDSTMLTDFALYTFIIYTLALFAGVAFIGRRIQQQWAQIGIQQLTGPQVQYSLLMGITAALSLTGGSLIAANLTGDLEIITTTLDTLAQETPLILSSVLVVTAIFAMPLAEELFFRGVLHTWIRRNRRPISAIFISGAIYAFLNVNPISIVPSILIGAGLALVYERTGSVWAAFLTHSTFNFVSMMLYIGLILL